MFRINRLLSYQIKSIPIVENPLSHFTLRVAHQVSRTSRHSVPTLVSFHQTLVENPPCLSLEPDTCSSRLPCTRLANSMGEISLFPSISRVASRKPRIDASLLDYYSIPNGCCWQRGGESFFFFFGSAGREGWVVVHEGDVDSERARGKVKGARLTSVLVMAWRIGRDWIEPTRDTSGLNERGWATETGEAGERETAGAAPGVGVGWLSGARVVG